VIDYLWEYSVLLITKALKGGGYSSFTQLHKIVTVGEMAGESISLSSYMLCNFSIKILDLG